MNLELAVKMKRQKLFTRQWSKPDVVVQAFIPCTQEAEGTGFREFGASQVYILNSRTAKDTYVMIPLLQKRGEIKKRKKRERERAGLSTNSFANHLVRKHYLESGMMVDSYNPSTQEAEAGELP